MNPKLITIITAVAVSALSAFAQEPPTPPSPPNPANAPGRPPSPPRDRDEKKVAVTYLGVETSDVPTVVCEQLGLAKGFGLVVDYVVPNGPAASAGIQQNDILKMLNDQILTEPDQLSKLVRSYSDGTSITLTVLRKGKEEKISVKLGKKDVPQHQLDHGRHGRHGMLGDFGDFGMSDLQEQMRDLQQELGEQHREMIENTVMKARAQAERAREQAAEQVRRAGDKIRLWSKDMNALKTTNIDIGKAQIVFSDDKGELRVEKIDGKKVLTAKDPQGRLLFSGPVESDEELAKVPADVRDRYTKLQKNELPAVIVNPDQSDDSESEDDDEPLPPDQVSRDTRLPRSEVL